MREKKIKPLETFYKGYRFRSRLEARWAVFFDALGVKWKYEPQGYKLPSGKCYLPDFQLKCYGTRGDIDEEPFDLFVEVKGKMTEEDAEKIAEFNRRIRKEGEWYITETLNSVLIVGDIPDVQTENDCTYSKVMGSYDEMDGIKIYPFNYITVDGDYFAAYPAARDGKFYLMGDDGNYINNSDLPLVYQAYLKAKQARFEHGEKG